MHLSRELADALCTVIAAGFIEANSSIAKVEGLISPDAPGTSHKTTKFVYESENHSDHMKVKDALEQYGIPFEIEIAENKLSQPFVFSKTRTVYDENTLKGIADDFHRPVRQTEDNLNRAALGSLPGAYIGGIATLNKIEFCGPSDLFVYESHYREDIGDEVGESYKQASKVSNTLTTFLDQAVKDPANFPLSSSYGKKPREIIYAKSKQHKVPENYDYDNRHLFASCHGMVRSIYDYLDYLISDGICVELALGPDTCKVASCLPCSLFMTSNNVPASATHLGRGDNWHYPQAQKRHRFTEAWRYTVIAAYKNGAKILTATRSAPPPVKVRRLMEQRFTESELPELFLEALTYESSFISKMKNTFNITDH